MNHTEWATWQAVGTTATTTAATAAYYAQPSHAHLASNSAQLASGTLSSAAVAVAMSVISTSTRSSSTPWYDIGDSQTTSSSNSDPGMPGAGLGGSRYAPWQAALITVCCSLIIMATVVGNILVCIAVAIVRKLRTPSNLLIVSLAVADMLVAILVMPFAITYEVFDGWVHGQTMCDAWTSLDVMLCTASILNLCMISIDRYFVITRPFQYAIKRTPRRMLAMIMSVWSLSALVSIPPLFGWKSPPKAGLCIVSQSVGYQFYATIVAFYLPLAVMIVIYSRIYMVSARIARHVAKSTSVSGGDSHLTVPLDTSRKNSNACVRAPSASLVAALAEENHNEHLGDPGKRKKKSSSSSGTGAPTTHHRSFAVFRRPRVTRSHSTSDSKATKTLGVIMGSFTACWLPFFIVALFKPLCSDPESCVPHWVGSWFLWLGYANSTLNPMIYARFNREFRTPFKEILLCRCRGINLRLRSESYAEQYGMGNAHLHVESTRPPLSSHQLSPSIAVKPVNSMVTFTAGKSGNAGQTAVIKLGNGKNSQPK